MDEFKSENNGWFSARFFGRVMRAIFHKVQEDQFIWSKQSNQLNMDCKYLRVTIDQRDGGFNVVGGRDEKERVLTTDELLTFYPRINKYHDAPMEKMVHHMVMGWLIDHYSSKGMNYNQLDSHGRINGPFEMSFLILVAETTGLIMMRLKDSTCQLPKHTPLQATVIDVITRFI